MSSNGHTLLSVKDLRTYFETEDGTVKAVDGISFDLQKGETLGIVGESGSGKSVTNLSIIRLVPRPPGRIVSGEVLFHGQDIMALADDDVRKIRGKRISMIFQDPMTSLNPFMRISKQLMEITELHLGHTKSQAYEHAIHMLELVGIPDARTRVDSYPHEFSGGMRRRVSGSLVPAILTRKVSCVPYPIRRTRRARRSIRFRVCRPMWRICLRAAPSRRAATAPKRFARANIRPSCS